ncbi:alpha/beta hydrolase [Phytomonospora sp. NPDC050363]|uniref:alpha/beta hydrolase family protein n=1 Tax=Phytomonospora sp. NPDC050363 TaxID=3155642 RepID=UPI0033FC4E96
MTAPQPPWVAPFVLDSPDVPRERHGHWDLCLPDADGPRPLVVFVHGGPVNPSWPASPRDWHVYRGYGAQAAARGFTAAVVDHRLYGVEAYPQAYEDVLEAVEGARADERVDAGSVAVWVFSGGGPMLAPLLRERPGWLKALGATYPALDAFTDAELPQGFRPLELVPEGTPIPLVFTRVGLEHDFLAAAQPKFVELMSGGPVEVEVVEVPNGVHGFDHTDYTAESREAVELALTKVLGHLA